MSSGCRDMDIVRFGHRQRYPQKPVKLFHFTFIAISRPLVLRLTPFLVHICAVYALQIDLMYYLCLGPMRILSYVGIRA